MFDGLKDSKILITGKDSQLAVYFLRTVKGRPVRVTACARAECDIADRDQVLFLVEREKPDVLINFAADNFIDRAEVDSARALAVNARGVKNLVDACLDNDTFLIHFSSSHVFNGRSENPYTEDDVPDPINAYGRSKAQGESYVIENMERYLLFRLSWAFGYGKNCFLNKVRKWAETQPVILASSDEISSPVFSQDVIDLMLKCMSGGLRGLYHLANRGQCSRYEYVKAFADLMGYTNEIKPVPCSHFQLPARRPLYTCLSTEKIEKDLGVKMESWREALARFVEHEREGLLKL